MCTVFRKTAFFNMGNGVEQTTCSETTISSVGNGIGKLELLGKVLKSERRVEILESLALKIGLKAQLGNVNSLLKAMKMEQEEEKLEFPALKVQLKESQVQMKSLLKKIKLFMTLGKQLKNRIKELKFLQEKLKLLQFTGELNSQTLEMELNNHAMKLESLLEEMKLEQAKGHWSRTLEMKWERHIKKSESLLNKIESEPEVEILEAVVWEMILKGHSAEEKSLQDNIKLIQERKLKSPSLETELKQHIAKLESLIVEMKLKQKEEKLESQMLDMELEEHMVKSELLLKERESLCGVEMLKSPVSKVQAEENIAKVNSRLETLKLKREKRKPEFATLEVSWNGTKKNLSLRRGQENCHLGSRKHPVYLWNQHI